MIYLDYAAATPVDDQVLAAMEPYWQDKFFNPSALYTSARQVKKDLNQARSDIAKLLGVKASEVLFTAGATEANNLAISGVMRLYEDSNLVISNIEHESIRGVAGIYKQAPALKVSSDGLIKPKEITSYVKEDTVLISIEYVNSEIGVVQPLAEIAKELAKIRQARQKSGNRLPLLLHTDASQAVGLVNFKPFELGVDLATVNGAKIYGPKQSGVLYINSQVQLQPLHYGGGQERGLRAGTENVSFAVGLAKAVSLAVNNQQTINKRYRKLQQQLLNGLKSIPDTQINGSLNNRVPSNVNVSFTGVEGEALVHHLDARGILAATGSACGANFNEPSHVLVALGMDPESIKGSLRISLGRYTTDDDIENTLHALAELVPKLRKQR